MPIENSIERVTHAGYFSSHVWKTMETKKISTGDICAIKALWQYFNAHHLSK